MRNTPKHAAWLLLPILMAGILFSCQKEVNNELDYSPGNARFPVTPKEKEIVDKIRKVELVLRKIYTDPKVVAEATAATKCGYYDDEVVDLKDLLNPRTSLLYASEKFRRLNVETGIFERKFKEEFDKMFGANNVVGRTTSDYFEDEGITIYFPYSEDFTDPKGSEITLVAADRDADEGPGNKPDGTNPDGSTKYVPVTVNDDYAAVSPTHIVCVIDKLPKADYVDSLPPPSGTVDRVFHGYSRLGKHYDKLISFTGNGGGSEIRVARASGYLQVQNQQVTSWANDVISVNYSRKDVRKKKWKRVYSAWDPDWVAANNEQVYAVWEDDTEGTKTFTGSLSTTLLLRAFDSTQTVQGSIGFSITVKTQDEIITQRKISRYAYFITAKQDQGGGFDMCDGCGEGDANPCLDNTFLPTGEYWPKWDCGTNWKYTWSYNIY